MNYEDGYFELLAERSTLKAKNNMLLAALENLLPYLEERSQPGERWAALCAREAISKVKGGE